MSTTLSIVIPSYNAADFLPVCIPSFMDIEEVYKNEIEIIIVNDGSKDETAEVAKRFEDHYPGIVTVVNKENGGHGSTINAGIQVATGKYFKVVDADDYVDSAEFEKLVKFLMETDVDQVITPYVMEYFVKGRKELMDYQNVTAGKTYDADEFLTLIGKVPEMHAIVYKTELLRANHIRLSENCFYVDIQYNVFPIHLVKTMAYCDAVVYQYQLGNINQSVSAQSYLKNKAMHEHVVKSVIEYCHENAAFISGTKQELIDKLLTGLVSTQINIYLSMPDIKAGQQEYGEFMKFLKDNHPYSIDHPFGKKAKVLKYLPFLFSTFAKMYQKNI